MSAVFFHQLVDHLRSLRFQVSLLILVVLFATNGVIYTLKNEQLVQDNRQIQERHDREFDGIETVAQAVSQWYSTPASRLATEFIAEGGANWFDDGHWMSPESGAGVMYSGRIRANNNFLRRYELVDWTFIVRIALSFLCIVLAYDSISRERQQGALQLCLANPLPRSAFVAGRFLAHLAVLLLTLVVAALVSLLVLALGGTVHVDGTILSAALLFLVGSTLYISFFLLVTMAVSALVRDSGTALVAMILLWALLIVMIPQSSYLLSVHSDDYVGRWEDTAWSSMDATWDRLAQEGLIMRPRELAATDGYAVEKQVARAIDEAEKEQWRANRETYERIVRQYRMAWYINLLSPGYAFQYATESFLGTGIIRYEDLLSQLWQYRQSLRDFLRTRDASDRDSPHVLYFSNYVSTAEIGAGEIPRFQQDPLEFGEGLAAGVVPIIVLVVEASAGLLLARWTFNRSDIAS
ncbi:ABC transporter permease subunit [Candidatus Latescibacterota bacterium]